MDFGNSSSSARLTSVQIKGIEDFTTLGGGRLRILIRHIDGTAVWMSCTFAPLRHWLAKLPKERAIAALRDHRMAIAIERGVVIGMATMRGSPSVEHELTEVADTPLRRSIRQAARRKFMPCPTCRKDVMTTEKWTSRTQRTYYCEECGRAIQHS